jgi:hypothetical protein
VARLRKMTSTATTLGLVERCDPILIRRRAEAIKKSHFFWAVDRQPDGHAAYAPCGRARNWEQRLMDLQLAGFGATSRGCIWPRQLSPRRHRRQRCRLRPAGLSRTTLTGRTLAMRLSLICSSARSARETLLCLRDAPVGRRPCSLPAAESRSIAARDRKTLRRSRGRPQ